MSLTKIKKPIKVHGDNSKESLGLVHVITGDGKGKTTAAIGLALRAIGYGYKVYMIQFLKSGGTGELYATKHVPNLKIEQFGVDAIKERQKAQTPQNGDAQAQKAPAQDATQEEESLMRFNA